MRRAQPVELPAGKKEAHYLRFRRAQCQKVARARRDDPTFSWRGLGKTCANDLMYLASGRYVTPDGGILSWGSPNARAILLYGKNAPFESLDDVPAHVLAEVEAGVADALAVGAHIKFDGLDIGRRLGLSGEMRSALRVWLLWPASMSRAEFEARHDRKNSDAAAKREKRRAAGVRPREEIRAGERRGEGPKIGREAGHVARALATSRGCQAYRASCRECVPRQHIHIISVWGQTRDKARHDSATSP